MLIAEHWTIATDNNEIPTSLNCGWGIRKPTLITFNGETRIQGSIEYSHERAIAAAIAATSETGINFRPKLISEVIESAMAEEALINSLLGAIGKRI